MDFLFPTRHLNQAFASAALSSPSFFDPSLRIFSSVFPHQTLVFEASPVALEEIKAMVQPFTDLVHS